MAISSRAVGTNASGLIRIPLSSLRSLRPRSSAAQLSKTFRAPSEVQESRHYYDHQQPSGRCLVAAVMRRREERLQPHEVAFLRIRSGRARRLKPQLAAIISAPTIRAIATLGEKAPPTVAFSPSVAARSAAASADAGIGWPAARASSGTAEMAAVASCGPGPGAVARTPAQPRSRRALPSVGRKGRSHWASRQAPGRRTARRARSTGSCA